MRNLKKVLALVLALVMSLSLVTIANATDFSDDADIDYGEAVDVMSAIGVIDGVGNNSFDPDGTLTREQAAKLITYMLMGANAEKLGVEATSFKDVAATRWSAAAIEYCATLGIIDGAGDGNFYPAGKLTGYAFAKMLLTALGYDSKIEGFTGPSWTINVASMGMEVGLHKGMENVFGSAELSRQEAAQMALNCIKAPLVQYTSGTTVTVGGQDVSVGSSRWEYVTTTIARQQNISDRRLTNSNINSQNTGYTVEFGEKYFPNLRLRSETDAFERPSHTWVFENKELGTYVDYDLLVEKYTAAVTYKELYELLGRSNLENYRFEYYVDGIPYTAAPALAPTATDFMTAGKILSRTTNDAGVSGRGVLTQVFVDHDFDEGTGLIKITSIRTWLGQVSSVYNTNREQASLNVFTDYTNAPVPTTNKMSKTVGVVDVPNVKDLTTEDEFVLVNMSGKDTGHTNPNSYGSANLWDVVKISEPQIMTDTKLTAFSKGTDKDWQSETTHALFRSVTADGVKYDASSKAAFNEDVLDLYNKTLLSDKTYNIYLDQYGYAIGVDLYAGNDNYVFITGFDMGDSAIARSNADAGAIFVDGTMKTINVNVKDTNKNIRNAVAASNSPDGDDYFLEWLPSNYTTVAERARVNRWFTYTEKNGVYTLTPATRMMTTNASDSIYTTNDKREKIKCNNVVLDRTTAHDDDKNDLGGSNILTHPAAAGNVRSYGNDNSVYLVAGLGLTDGGTAITSVEGVYTGVQNVEIDLFTALPAHANAEVDGSGKIMDQEATPSPVASILYDNTYTVFDKNNYIIASVVLGEIVGGNANYVYALTAAKNERVENDKYYWEFDAVVDGQIKTLTVEDKFNNTIQDLRPGHIQEVRYNGDYVVAINNIKDSKIYVNPNEQIDPDVKSVYDIGHVTNSVSAITKQYPDGTVVAGRYAWDCEVGATSGHYTHSAAGDADYGTTDATGAAPVAAGYKNTRLSVTDLKLVGRTLYLDVGKDFGLPMANQHTPTVLIQDEMGKEDVQTYFEDISGAISAMADNDTSTSNGKGFTGRITAVLDGQGRAKWVVITSDTIVPYNAGGSVTPVTTLSNVYSSFSASSDVLTLKDTGNAAVQTSFKLDQFIAGSWYEIGSFTTNAGGNSIPLPTVSGGTYRATVGKWSFYFSDNI